MKNLIENPQEFDFTRNDKLYILTIPAYKLEGDLVLYEIVLRDLVNAKQFISWVRFKSIKEIHQKLSLKNIDLPPFPRTHFWKKTNSHPVLIEERRKILQHYLNTVINDKYLRGQRDVKKYVKLVKNKDRLMHSSSLQKRVVTSITKSRSRSNCSNETSIVYKAQLKNSLNLLTTMKK